VWFAVTLSVMATAQRQFGSSNQVSSPSQKRKKKGRKKEKKEKKIERQGREFSTVSFQAGFLPYGQTYFSALRLENVCGHFRHCTGCSCCFAFLGVLFLRRCGKFTDDDGLDGAVSAHSLAEENVSR
jgi:hypothetical protein